MNFSSIHIKAVTDSATFLAKILESTEQPNKKVSRMLNKCTYDNFYYLPS